MNAVLISTYELGHQPFGLASPAAWLRARGASVTCLDLSREPLRPEVIREAHLIAFYVPMHTATRLAAQLVAPVRELNPRAHLCFYCLYAPVNEEYLRALGVDTIIGGEFEEKLARLVDHLQEPGHVRGPAGEIAFRAFAAEPVISLDRLKFLIPDRSGLPPLRDYAHLLMPGGERRISGYTEASRGCKHFCRHCPIVPVYNGVFRIVPREIVLEDIRRQVDAGAEHIAFGDPDFFNGPAHALSIVEALHREFPRVSYDVIIKIEHLLRSRTEDLAALRDTGCLFVTSAVESLDDACTCAPGQRPYPRRFLECRAAFPYAGPGSPTHVCTLHAVDHARKLSRLARGDRRSKPHRKRRADPARHPPADSRGLAPAGARKKCATWSTPSNPVPWSIPGGTSIPVLDALAARVQELAAEGDRLRRSRTETFALIWRAACDDPQPPALRGATSHPPLQRALVLLRRANPGAVRYHRRGAPAGRRR